MRPSISNPSLDFHVITSVLASFGKSSVGLKLEICFGLIAFNSLTKTSLGLSNSCLTKTIFLLSSDIFADATLPFKLSIGEISLEFKLILYTSDFVLLKSKTNT